MGTALALIKSKWVDGNLIFYDSATPTQYILTIKCADGGLVLGADTLGIDFKVFGATTGKYMLWDESLDNLSVVGTATVDGAIASKTIITSKTSGATVTYTAAEMVGGMISDANTEANAATTPTATQLIAAIPNAAIGSSFLFILKNASAGAYTITLTAGVDITITGTATVAQNNTKIFLVVVTSVTSHTATIYSLGTLVH